MPEIDFTLNRFIVNSLPVNGATSLLGSSTITFSGSSHLNANPQKLVFASIEFKGTAELANQTTKIIYIDSTNFVGSANVKVTGINFNLKTSFDSSLNLGLNLSLNGYHNLNCDFTLSSNLIASVVKSVQKELSFESTVNMEVSAARVIASDALLNGNLNTLVEHVTYKNRSLTLNTDALLIANPIRIRQIESVAFNSSLAIANKSNFVKSANANINCRLIASVNENRLKFSVSFLLGKTKLEALPSLRKTTTATILISGNVSATALRSVQPKVELLGSGKIQSKMRFNVTLPVIPERTFTVSRPSRIMYTTG